jgi:hypothetical protein
MEKKLYYCMVEGVIDGAHRSVNDELQLTDREAKYLIMSGLIGAEKKVVQVDAVKEPDPATLDMKTRKA